MKRTRMALLLIPALFMVQSAFSQPDPAGKDSHFNPGSHFGDRGSFAMGPWSQLPRLFNLLDELSVSDQQMLDMRKVFQKHHNFMASFTVEMRESRNQFKEFMKSGTDHAIGQQLAEKQGADIRKIALDRIELREELQKILTPDQQAKMQKIMEKQQDMFKKWQKRSPNGKQEMSENEFHRGRGFQHKGAKPPFEPETESDKK
ncbi:MAG: hypothetical protein HQM09_17945 [Candidatus Riflebacteria bacterium]|nr:hypothetical protein [Candidatus Riflebacteria bacterium]